MWWVVHEEGIEGKRNSIRFCLEHLTESGHFIDLFVD